MVTMSSEYSIYLYRDRVDLRKGITGLSGIVRDEMRMNPYAARSIYVFSGRNPRIKKVLMSNSSLIFPVPKRPWQ